MMRFWFSLRQEPTIEKALEYYNTVNTKSHKIIYSIYKVKNKKTNND